jgi:hypothetical protein
MILSGTAAESIQTINKQTQVAQGRSIASSSASGPSTAGQKLVDALPDALPKLSRTDKKRANKEGAAEKAKPPPKRRLRWRPM